jgi:hypothetical protein
MTPRLRQTTQICQLFFALCEKKFACFCGLYDISRRWAHLARRLKRLVRVAVPAGAAVGTPQIQTFEHQPKFPGVDLYMAPPRRRLHGQGEGASLEPFIYT